ncbi:hypothetical protein BACOVA_04497 [Bacteroides ovatus ATCC 8483]|uniref:Uncharacterized protein n=1 Tax=Bacteroides ovatus (strain ATCC 8483 / DSM 1896 / JCM 5824 / BCRC 10623 / CCUG 4943 / NCTC 11153) TaxID=411476 RepID=A0AAN3D670_BACO1|nr:hypothetical protein BACOVA_04497 [Bacteroides ovatus ATCC 8483]
MSVCLTLYTFVNNFRLNIGNCFAFLWRVMMRIIG